jgi:hypothetical protein
MGDFLKTGSAPRQRSSSRHSGARGLLAVLGFWVALTAGFAARADQGSSGTFEVLQKRADAALESDHLEGWGYLISGGVALGVSIPAFYLSEDVFAKAVYSLTETLGVAAVGYGAYLVLLDNDMSRFVKIVRSVPKLSRVEQDQLADAYLRESADRARNVRKIRVISHGLTAVINLVNAVTSSNQNLAEALYFLGGVNTLAAIGFAFNRSDEEKAVESRQASVDGAGIRFFAGPVSGVAIRF